MNRVIAWMRGKAGGWFARETARRLAVPAGTLAVAAVWTADPVSWRRILASASAILIVPLLCFMPVRAIVSKRSNGANAALLASLVSFDVLCAAWSVHWRVDSWIAALIAAIFVAMGMFYNVWIMTFALKLEAE